MCPVPDQNHDEERSACICAHTFSHFCTLAYFTQVLEEFKNVVYGIPAGKPGNTIALFGHAVFHNAVAWRMASFWGLNDESLQDLLELELGEAEGLWITRTAAGTTVRHLHTKALAPVGISAHPLF